MARDAITRSKELEEDAQQNRAKVQAMEQQLLALGHPPCTDLEEHQQGKAASASRRHDHVGNAGALHDSARSLPKVPRLGGGGGATAEAVSRVAGAASASAAAAQGPRESVLGKLASLSAPSLKRRADGTWGEGDDVGGKRTKR